MTKMRDKPRTFSAGLVAHFGHKKALVRAQLLGDTEYKARSCAVG